MMNAVGRVAILGGVRISFARQNHELRRRQHVY
jgi:hypothetical protein